MALLDLLGRTWALGILWNSSGARHTFRELQARCEQISPSLLNTRLKELRGLKLIDHDDQGYGLTPMGQELIGMLSQLGPWSSRWAEALQDLEEDVP